MLISETVRTIVHATSLAVTIAGAAAAVRHLLRFAGKLPRAAVIAERSLAPRIWSLIPIVGLPLGIAAFAWASSHKIEVLLVRDGHSVYGDRAFEHRLGSSPLEFSVATGNKEIKPLLGGACWTVNASAKPIRLVRIQYPPEGTHFKETESVTVLPGQRVSDCDFNYYGPEFAPPGTLQSMAHARWDFASWLTWDEPK